MKNDREKSKRESKQRVYLFYKSKKEFRIFAKTFFIMIKQSFQNFLSKNNFQQLNPKVILFDMDGILFDSMPSHAKAWLKVMNENNLPFTESEVYLNEGQPAADTIDEVIKKTFGRKSTENERTEIYADKVKYFDELGEPKRMPFVIELLNLLKENGFSLGVVTGSAQPTLLENIEHHFPGFFRKENIVSAFDVERGKPFPEPYLKALQKLDVKPWEAVVVENAPFGVKASSAAQIYTIGVNTGPIDKNILTEYGADIVFDSMQELYEKWNEFGF